MPEKVSIDVIPQVRDAVFDLVSSYPRSKRFGKYADVRLEVSEGKGAVAENGMDKFSAEDYGFAFGVRVLAGHKAIAPGYFGELIGTADLPRLNQRLREALDHAYERASASAASKAAARERFGALAGSLYDMTLAPIEVRQDTVDGTWELDPREVPLEDAQPADRLYRFVERMDHLLAGGFLGIGGFGGEGAARAGDLAAIGVATVDQPFGDHADAARPIDIDSDEVTARFEIDQDRSAIADSLKIID